MITEQKSQIPILIIAFNRPSILKECLEKLKESSVGKLYFAIDGPRHPEEAILVNRTKKIVKDLKWPNEVRLRISEKNEGCHKWVSSSVSWFFENEEFGIILEEDILLDSRFFEWCEQIKHLRHKDNKIMHINAFAPDVKFLQDPKPHYSKYCTSWGWATWRDAWAHYDDKMSFLFDKNLLKRILYLKERISCGWLVALFYVLALKMTQQGKLSSWAYRWNYSVWASGGFSVSPGINLSQNIGVGEGASHTSKEMHIAEFKPATKNVKISSGFAEYDVLLDKETFNSIMLCNNWKRLSRMSISVITPNPIFFYIRKFFR